MEPLTQEEREEIRRRWLESAKLAGVSAVVEQREVLDHVMEKTGASREEVLELFALDRLQWMSAYLYQIYRMISAIEQIQRIDLPKLPGDEWKEE